MLGRFHSFSFFIAASFLPSSASAARLISLWQLEPVVQQLPTEVRFGDKFLEQRLLPASLVELLGDGGKAAATGTKLYLVQDTLGSKAYCTFKDMSGKNQAASLFIPILDRRPCFVDQDGDGDFDTSFSVFDKYGSMLTPSGNMNSARPLTAAIPYRTIDPRQAQSTMRIAFVLAGSKDPSRARIEIKFDKRGRGRWEDLVGEKPFDRDGAKILALNALVTVESVTDNAARVALALVPRVIVTGSSNGFLTVYTPPSDRR